MADRRTVVAVGAAFAALRVAASLPFDPVNGFPDSETYRQVSFVGDAVRPWVVPLVWQLPGKTAVVAQAVIGAVAFLALALALAGRMRTPAGRWLAGGSVLLLGLTPAVTRWDAAMLSESLALSSTALLLATFVWWAERRAEWAAWAMVAVFVAWVFSRDAHLFLGVLVVAAVAGAAVVRRRSWWPAAAMVLVLVWAGWASQADSTIETGNALWNVADRIADDADARAWFVEHGMPDSPALDEAWGMDRRRAVADDPAVLQWARDDGARTYVAYAVTHPGFLLSGPLRSLVIGDGELGTLFTDTSSYVRPIDVLPPPVANLVWPAGTGTLAVLLAGCVAGGWLRRRQSGEDQRWGLPLVLLVLAFPALLVAWHGSPIELARHGLVVVFVVYVALYHLAALLVEGVGERDETPDRSRGSIGRDVGEGRLAARAGHLDRVAVVPLGGDDEPEPARRASGPEGSGWEEHQVHRVTRPRR